MRGRQGGVRATSKFTPLTNAILTSSCVKNIHHNSQFIVPQNQIPFAFIKHVYPLNLIDGFKDYLCVLIHRKTRTSHNAHAKRK